MPNTNMAVLEQENPVRNLPGPYPFKYPTPYTPRGYKFPLKPCRLFLTRLESMPLENFSLPNSPAS
jgi:hypothetical protein